MNPIKQLSTYFAIFVVLGFHSVLLGAEIPKTLNNFQEITFYHPSGMNGFIVYDLQPNQPDGGMSYGSQTFDLSTPLGLPVTVEVESLNLSEGSYNIRALLQESESNYLEIFSFQHALAYGPKSSLSPYAPTNADITMVIASANYQATDRFSAKFSTGLSQTVKEKSRSSSDLGYELDIAGFYEIAPGLTFSMGAGYGTTDEVLSDSTATRDDKGIWSLNSMLRMKF